MKRTDEQILEALNESGTIDGAWRKFGSGKTPGSFRSRCRRIAALVTSDAESVIAASKGVSDIGRLSNPVAPGFVVKGYSTLTKDADGNTIWIKTRADDEERMRALAAAIPALADPIRGSADPVRSPSCSDSDTLAAYIIGDAHIAMYAHAEECGENWDLSIAERIMCSAIDGLIESMPPSDEALLVNVGDLLHSNDATNLTPGHGHQLDVDGRWHKVLRVALRILRYYVDACLAKHQRVTVYMARGNHDSESSIAVALALDALYEREPRVTIDTSPAWYKYHRFGSNLVGITHGDGCKPEKLPELMAAERARDWGEAKHRTWWTGHVHHLSVRESPGCVVETFRTLAAKDAWHSRKAYRSGREMKAILLHRKYGEKRRITESLEMIDDRS